MSRLRISCRQVSYSGKTLGQNDSSLESVVKCIFLVLLKVNPALSVSYTATQYIESGVVSDPLHSLKRNGTDI